MSGGQTLGVLDMVWGGEALDSEKGGKLKLGGWKQNATVTQGKVFYTREYEASEITFTTVLKLLQRIFDIFSPGTKELQVNCDTGQSFTFGDAFVSNRPEMTAGEGGKIEVKIMAGAYEELLNG